jgi:hypothetical protein
MNILKKITDYVLCSEGFYWPDYYQGFGTGPGISQEHATLGAGTTEREAFEDAMEQLAEMGWNVSAIESDEDAENLSDEQDPEISDPDSHEEGRMYYFGIRWNEPDGMRECHSEHGFSLKISWEDALSGSHSGSCDEDVTALLKKDYIAEQFDKISPEDIRAELREYGAWEKEELADDAENRARLLWCACGMIKEDERGDK